MVNKIRIGVVFGGKSAEHEISLQSAKNIVEALDKSKYEVTLLGIAKSGEWYIQELPAFLPQQTELPLFTDESNSVMLVPHHQQPSLIKLNNKTKFPALDVIFPVLHGPNGEDGTIQGLLRMVDIPFVGSDVLSNAVCMDKDIMKRLLRDAGLRVVPWKCIHQKQRQSIDTKVIIEEIGLPCFVKPANLGSSVGISKVKNEQDLLPAIDHAFLFDQKILIEKSITGREIECAVLGNDNPIASLPGEIIPHHEFYSYEAKYLDQKGATCKAPAELPTEIIHQVQSLAIQSFEALCCEGMARVDFFLTQENKLYVNELNTIPGFTRISMYPKLWEISGISYSELVDRLVKLALDKYDRAKTLKIDYR